MVRKDLIPKLPLPRRIIDYLSTPHYYSEQLIEIESDSENQPPINPNALNNISNGYSSEGQEVFSDSGDEEVARIGRNMQLNNYNLLSNRNLSGINT